LEADVKVLISGSAGFIGGHATARFLRDGATVVGFDNLSRPGTAENLAWLQAQPGTFLFSRVDISRAADVTDLFAQHRDADVVLHLAGQVAVTSSIADPRRDFEANALGTLNVLEAARA
jgi:CDP-paratose 2-epimerase